MPKIEALTNSVFSVNGETAFNRVALEVFRYQYKNNVVYNRYVNFLNRDINKISHYRQIPFLPVEFFKNHKVVAGNFTPRAVFTSSGTTGMSFSRHLVADLYLYERSFVKGFEHFFGPVKDYVFLALLPSYLEREGSSLIYMAQKLITLSGHAESGFYLNEYEQLSRLLSKLKALNKKTVLLGVTYALLDLAEEFPVEFPDLIIMETGGMKGKRKEMVREVLHKKLSAAFGVEKIYSEYGMTELLSQAYSKGNGLFETPPWMKIVIRDTNDPLSLLPENKTGGVNIIDLANIYSCSFIETKDLGKLHASGQFEILGRFDDSDVRGCNLLVG
jgi:phenylacetate-coenzyme A ligase PaaK-like adenylate-forming protein